MKKNNIPNGYNELKDLCNTVRKLVEQKKYQECEKIISEEMGKYPHAPQPHNLIGILLEHEGDHVTAMKHFRAAWSLDPTYIPARYNMERYSDIYTKGQCAFDETDCQNKNKKDLYKVEYDEHGVGHVVKRQ